MSVAVVSGPNLNSSTAGLDQHIEKSEMRREAVSIKAHKTNKNT